MALIALLSVFLLRFRPAPVSDEAYHCRVPARLDTRRASAVRSDEMAKKRGKSVVIEKLRE
jgi:hypothetical protein